MVIFLEILLPLLHHVHEVRVRSVVDWCICVEVEVIALVPGGLSLGLSFLLIEVMDLHIILVGLDLL